MSRHGPYWLQIAWTVVLAAGIAVLFTLIGFIGHARTLADWLKLEGHTVYVFFDGPSALDFAAPDHIDAFVLDIGLPGMDGREVARRLRARPDTKESLLIALSGYGQAVDLERSAAAGFDHHLVKPADPEALQHLLAQA